jgi:hypothetical protein
VVDYKGKNWKGKDWKGGRFLDGRMEGWKIGRDKLCSSSILPLLPFFLFFPSFQP